ncbi:MAG: hypothetical protein BGO31_04720 [Bacteroidetes bacterium 43-16]|nr:MAG: hypothetical protein BGO31_04720 [Bacteroidetes bacterium 43-16]
MKTKFFKSIFIAAALSLMTIVNAIAGTFYVCSGTAFTLTPSVSTFSVYEWSDGATVVQTGSSPNLVQTVTLSPATTAIAKTYTLRVQDGNGCWSAQATHTVYVLPALTASIAGATAICSNVTLNETLTASTNYGALNLTAAPGLSYNFTWTGGGTVSGTNNHLNQVTTSGTYGVSVAYVLPTNDGSKMTGCTGTASHTIITNTAPTTPSVTIQ